MRFTLESGDLSKADCPLYSDEPYLIGGLNRKIKG